MVIIHFLEMSLLGTILILIMLVIRKMSMKRVPYSLIIILWQAILVRLLVPAAIPISISPLNRIEQFKSTMSISENIKIIYSNEVLYTENIKNNIHTLIKTLPVTTLYELLKTVFFIGIIGFILFFVVRFIFSYKLISEALPIIGNTYINEWLLKNSKGKKVKIMVSDRISTPITCGIWAAKIILPKRMDYSAKDLEYILTHEMIHIRYFHVLWKRIAMLVLCIHWFNPIVWIMYFLFNKDLEIACDEKVILRLGDTERESYALTIIHFASSKSELFDINSNFGKSHVEERIMFIMKKRNKSVLIAVCAMSAGLASTCIFATTFAETPQISMTESQVNQQTFKEYAPYGLMYDKKSNMYFYKEKSVKLFYDRLDQAIEKYKMFTRPKGEVSVKAVRDAKNKLVGLELAKEKDLDLLFNNANNENINEQLNTEAIETSKTPQVNNFKLTYHAYGVAYNKNNDTWEMNGTIIALLYDKGYHTYFNNSEKAVKEGLQLKVTRDKNGNIISLTNITEKEIANIEGFNEGLIISLSQK